MPTSKMFAVFEQRAVMRAVLVAALEMGSNVEATGLSVHTN